MQLLLLSSILALGHFGAIFAAAPSPVYPCDSQIFCQGPILDAVNKYRLYEDSKHYVDMVLVKSPNETLEAFNTRFPDKNKIRKESLQEFIDEHFQPPGTELVAVEPSDWTPRPSQFDVIQDPDYRNWAYDLHAIWKTLCRKVNASVASSPEKYSILYLPDEFMVPGGRFREQYYWDSYWVMRALIRSGMHQTARAMIRNYLRMVQKFGMIPNGGRVYYLKRSQPPMLIPMVYEYFLAFRDRNFIKTNFGTLEKEVDFWRQNRSLTLALRGKQYLVYHYNTDTNTPRPESYRVDVNDALNLPAEDQANIYSNIASSAESGWDFSSRWFADHASFRLHKTRLVLPVDLNAFLCQNFRMLSILAQYAENNGKAERYNDNFNQCVRTMMDVFYNETHGVWFDFHLDTFRHNTDFYPSNLVPLFAQSYQFLDNELAYNRILKYLEDSKALEYPDGLVTSFRRTGQQWDWPNAWAPLVHMAVEGMDYTQNDRLKKVAYYLAEHWTRHNHRVFRNTTAMYEKYDIVNHKMGHGGEYEVQVGFGWTNGVILEFLMKYGHQLSASLPLSSRSVFQDAGK